MLGRDAAARSCGCVTRIVLDGSSASSQARAWINWAAVPTMPQSRSGWSRSAPTAACAVRAARLWSPSAVSCGNRPRRTSRASEERRSRGRPARQSAGSALEVITLSTTVVASGPVVASIGRSPSSPSGAAGRGARATCSKTRLGQAPALGRSRRSGPFAEAGHERALARRQMIKRARLRAGR